jgi:hypothetical protein
MTRNIANARGFVPLALLSLVVAHVSCGSGPPNDVVLSSPTATNAVPREEAVSRRALGAAAGVAASTPCGGSYEECCTTGPSCGEHLGCDTSCVITSMSLICGVTWASGPGVCLPTFPPPTNPTGICAPDELQCGIDCAVGDYDVGAVCAWGGAAGVTVDPWCFSDYEGPFYACPVGPVDGGGTRYACTYVNNDPLNCGQCGVVCPDGKSCSAGSCW